MKYEMLYIVPTPFTENDVPQIQEKVVGLIKDLEGKVEKSENLGNHKLAYEIKHIKRGFYILKYFTLETDKIKTLGQKLKLMPEVLRFQILKTSERKPTTKSAKVKSSKKTLEEILETDSPKETPKKAEIEDIDKLLEI